MIKEIIERIQYIDGLIQERNTGTAAELAQKIGVTEMTIYKYIEMMKGIGAPIAFNALAKTYYYKENGSLVCAFFASDDKEKPKSAGPEKKSTNDKLGRIS